ncbi:MAG: sulfatase-like hydrolase/transferase, partial [bacterium]|nr:sulfatase-like hydrolase/transferase [bacterium]
SPRTASLRLYDMTFSTSGNKENIFNDCKKRVIGHLAHTARATLNGDMKIGIMQHPKSSIVYFNCYIPAESVLKFSLGLHPRVQEQDAPVTFSVFVKENIAGTYGKGTVIFTGTLTKKDMATKSWKDFSVDLSKFAGKFLSFSFNVAADVDPYKVLAAWGEPKIYSKGPRPRHNVILITMDALRADRLGTYGYPKRLTPNLDRFAKDSVLYSKCYSTAPWTLPSFASMYTSLYPKTHNVKRKDVPRKLEYEKLHRRFPTLPLYFRAYNYLTQIISWHPFLAPSYGLTTEFEYKDADQLNRTPLYMGHINRQIKMLAQENFLLHLHIIPPHSPYNAISPYDEKFVDFKNPLLKEGDLKFYYSPYSNDSKRWGKGNEDPEVWNLMSDLYDANLALSDEFFGKVIQQIKDLGLYKDSLIIFTADHGEQFWEHGTSGHAQSLYNEEIHVPLMIKFPKEYKHRGKRLHSLVSTIDILPTILEINNIPMPDYFHGQPLIDRRTKKLREIKRKAIFISQQWPRFKSQGVISGGYKYIYSPVKKTHELYNMTEDPHEKTNLAEKKLDILEKLKKLLKDYQLIIKATQLSKSKLKEDSEEVKKLKSLGYL